MKTTRKTMLLIFISIFSFLEFYAQSVSVSGTRRKWHRITLNITVPGAALSEVGGTFTNRRLDVIFTDPNGNNIRVPGFFAADGNAENTGATSGRTYRAYLRPYMTGNWSYEVLFYSGSNVASANVGALPTPSFSSTGNINNILNTNKSIPDLRALGRFTYQTSGPDDSRRYLRYAETGDYFIKFGPDSPENFLDFNEFDRDPSFNNCGNRCFEHEYNPHASDFNTGDPTWDNGRGRNIIGAINFLSENARVNSISMSLFGGDDVNVFPWTRVNQRTTYDVSKLAQWEIVFDHAERKGLFLHFKLAEAENWRRLSNNEIRVYYREMVARFGHHLGVEWNIAEEFGSTLSRTQNLAPEVNPRTTFLSQLDPWQNLRVLHTRPEDTAKRLYENVIDIDVPLTGASMQNQAGNRYREVFDLTLDLINQSRANNMPWVVASDEQAPANRGIFNSTNPSNGAVTPNGRIGVLWNNLMAGGAGVMWYGGSLGDFQTEDFRRFNTAHAWCRNAITDFFQGQNIQFWEMRNNNNLISGSANHCLANIGEQYVVYLPNGGTANLNLNNQTGNFNVNWFNPRNGGNLLNGSVTSISGGGNRALGNPPNTPSSDWAVLITRANGGGGTPPPSGSDEFFIVNRRTGLKLRPESAADVAPLIQVAATETNDFVRWERVDTTGDFFFLRNVETGMYFRPASNDNGAALEQRPTSFSGSRTQWRQIASSGDFFFLENRASGLYFRPVNTAVNSEMIQRPTTFVGSFTQWTFESASSSKNIADNTLNSLTISPNPVSSTGILNIDSSNNNTSNIKVTVLDITGKYIYAQTLNGSTSINMDNLNINSGIYLLKIDAENTSKIIKLLVE